MGGLESGVAVPSGPCVTLDRSFLSTSVSISFPYPEGKGLDIPKVSFSADRLES